MTAELIVFVIFAVAAIAGGLVMVSARNPIHSAMGLLLSMFSMAVFYVLNDAHFVAAIQVLIYAGAVMTLFLFVIMLIGVDRSDDPTERLPLQRPLAIVLGVGLLALIVVAGSTAWVTGRAVTQTGANGTIEAISDQLFGTWLLPFESTVLLLTIAAVGTVALAKFAFPVATAPPPLTVVDSPDELLARYRLEKGTGRGEASLVAPVATTDAPGEQERPGDETAGEAAPGDEADGEAGGGEDASVRGGAGE